MIDLGEKEVKELVTIYKNEIGAERARDVNVRMLKKIVNKSYNGFIVGDNVSAFSLKDGNVYFYQNTNRNFLYNDGRDCCSDAMCKGDREGSWEDFLNTRPTITDFYAHLPSFLINWEG